MGSQYKEDCPFCADNARQRREEAEQLIREAMQNMKPVSAEQKAAMIAAGMTVVTG